MERIRCRHEANNRVRCGVDCVCEWKAEQGIRDGLRLKIFWKSFDLPEDSKLYPQETGQAPKRRFGHDKQCWRLQETPELEVRRPR